MSNTLVTPPRRPRLIQYYSSLYYKDRVKPVFEAEWEAIEKLPVAEGAKKPAKINVRNRVTKVMWEKESQEVRDLVEMKVEAHHKKALKEFETLQKAPTERSAEDYHM